MKILVINGPNINMLGIRETNIYGLENYSALCERIKAKGEELGIDIELYQSNTEGDIVTKIQEAFEKVDGIIINPGAYTHYSIAILDALKSITLPTIEVHISNIQRREDFRKDSITAQACIGQISGLGILGYELAIEALKKHIKG
ncbi:MAG: type II 3-dehydroquinate dehydratase [Andreesenia angusta]|nr:type II 3-dehydroquinate dehydratase [Andreesenia angusta]